MFAVAVVLVALAASLPVDLYEPLPQRRSLPDPPVQGITLLRLSLLSEAAVLFAWGLFGTGYRRLSVRSRVTPTPSADSSEPFYGALVLISLLALALRAFRLNSELWLDEISALRSISSFCCSSSLTS